MMAAKAIIPGDARIRAGWRAARHFADLLGLTPRPALDRPGADLARVDGVIVRRVLRHEQLSSVPPGTRCCPATTRPVDARTAHRPALRAGQVQSPVRPAAHLRGSETASITIIERL